MSPLHRILSVFLAVVFLAAGIVTVVEIIGAAVGHRGPVVLPYARPGRWLNGQPWTAHWVIAGLIVFVVVGLLLLITAVKPRRPGLLVLHADVDGVTVGAPRRSVARAISRVAGDVDGISGATADLGSRTAAVSAATHLRDTTGLAEQVQEAVTAFLGGLGLERPPQVRVSLDQRER